MKLSHDCIRDLMLYLEQNLSYNDELEINNLQLKDYTTDELMYTTEKLSEADFLICDNSIEIDDEYPIMLVNSITYKGHQFLDSIRDDKIWKNTKKTISKLASASLPIIQEVASSLIKSSLGLN